MLKKILISLGVVVVLLVAAYFYLDNRNRTLSPRGAANLTNGELTVDITYSRPSVRDRLIFGTEDDEALQPYGKYWRLGANESTEVTFSQDVLLVDQPVKKGTYRMYAIPGPQYFELRLNSELGEWGAFEADSELDILSVMIPVLPSEHTEQFTIALEPLYDTGVKIVFKWDKIKMEVPVITE
jgi:hypothetical protein